MCKVLLALVPGSIAYAWVYGGAIVLSLLIATISALLAEAAMLKLRQRPVQALRGDMSAVVTAWLLTLTLPPLTPWWLLILGTFFAIVIAKHIYGGLGCNPFNPAMLGYAVVLIAFPQMMTASPLALTSAPIFGSLAATELVSLGYLIGGLYLIQQRIISWHLPTAFLAALALIAGGFYVSNPVQFTNPLFELMRGASMLCAFFIITDPVSGASSAPGKLCFSAGAGIVSYLLQVYVGSAYALAFAVLLMNLCVPWIDAATRPRVFGHKSQVFGHKKS
jgi:electron transport complex protein RnfD